MFEDENEDSSQDKPNVHRLTGRDARNHVDFSALLAIEQGAFLNPLRPNDIESLLRQGVVVSTASDDKSGQTIGYFILMPQTIARQHTLLVRLAVHPRFQNQGAGSKLMALAKESMGRSKVLLCRTNALETEAEGFLQKHGFVFKDSYSVNLGTESESTHNAWVYEKDDYEQIA